MFSRRIRSLLSMQVTYHIGSWHSFRQGSYEDVSDPPTDAYEAKSSYLNVNEARNLEKGTFPTTHAVTYQDVSWYQSRQAYCL